MNFDFMNNSSTKLFSPEQGYNLGNMFQDLYDQYKNYRPEPLRANTNKEKSYLELSRISFAMHEMNLYLDVHPDDKKILQLFNDYRKMFVKLQNEYEEKYGPLTTCSDALEKSPFAWEEDAFPWEDDINV